ncbi:MAG: hypothetical protein ACRCWM_10020 [Sarcina sp.]
MINYNHQAQVQYVQEAHTTQKNYEKKEGSVEINYTVDNKEAGKIANSNNINQIFNTKNNNLTVNIPENLMNEYSLKSISVNGTEYIGNTSDFNYDGPEITLSNCKAFKPNEKNIVTVNLAKVNFKQITSVKSGTYQIDGQYMQYTNYTLPNSSEVHLDKVYLDRLIGSCQLQISPELLTKYNVKSLTLNGVEIHAKDLSINEKTGMISIKNSNGVEPLNGYVFQAIVNFANKKVAEPKASNVVAHKSTQNSEANNVQATKKLSVKLSYRIDNGVNVPIKMTEADLQNMYIHEAPGDPEVYIELPQELLNQNILESITVNGHNYTTKDGAFADGPNVSVLPCYAYKNDGANTITVNLKKPNFKEITSVKSGTYQLNGNTIQYTNYTLPGESQVYLDKGYPYYDCPNQMFWGNALKGYKLQISPKLLDKYKVKSVTINGVEIPASSLVINEKTGTITIKSNPNNAQALNGFAFQQIVNFANKEGKVLVNKTEKQGQPKVENTALNNESTSKKLSSVAVEPQSKQVTQTLGEGQTAQISSLPDTGINNSKHSDKTVGAGVGLLVFLAAVGGAIGFKKRR